MPDLHSNWAYGTVLTAPSPATSGTSLVLNSGQGASFPTAPFNAWAWPAGVQPTTSNAEIVRVTVKSTDTLTITRAQEGSTARSIAIGWQVAAGVTVKTLTDIENAINYAADAGSTDAYAVTLSPVPSAYVTGQVVLFKANTINTGAATLNVNSLGAKTIKKNVTSDLDTGDIAANQVIAVVYDGTNFQLISSPNSIQTGAWTGYTPTYSASSSQTWTSVTTNTAQYKVIGKTMFLEVYALGTVGGTPSDGLIFSIPSGYTFAASPSGNKLGGACGVVDNNTRKGGHWYIASSSTIQCDRYDSGSFTGGTGGVNFNGVFEIA